MMLHHGCHVSLLQNSGIVPPSGSFESPRFRQSPSSQEVLIFHGFENSRLEAFCKRLTWHPSGTNFFFEWIPAGEYTLTYRLRASMAGTFKVAPATMQSMYAPEFAAFSAGDTVTVD